MGEELTVTQMLLYAGVLLALFAGMGGAVVVTDRYGARATGRLAVVLGAAAAVLVVALFALGLTSQSSCA